MPKANRAIEQVATFRLNGKTVHFEGAGDTPLLWVLRDHFKLTGTKFGCGIGQCGACTVHVDGHARRSCITPVNLIVNTRITTIEGLSESGEHPVQQAWLELDVPQCGYCQAGQIMAVTDFLNRFPNPTNNDINQNITNLCRCGTYVRIREAIHSAAKLMRDADSCQEQEA